MRIYNYIFNGENVNDFWQKKNNNKMLDIFYLKN